MDGERAEAAGAPVPPEPAGLPPRVSGLGRCLVMGVVNVTPDSFSDGGRWFGPDGDVRHDLAVEHGRALLDAGADLLDVGGESTRPGADRVPVDEELRRVLPVVRGLAAAGAVVSVDTVRAEVARAALDAGAALVNDVSGGLADPRTPAVVAAAGVPYVAMHWRGPSKGMDRLAVYDDVVRDVTRELAERVEALVEAGVDLDRIVLDPGFGFAKDAAHSWALLAGLDHLAGLGRPLLVGTSRKRFLAAAVTGRDASSPGARDGVTAATSVLAAAAGAWCVRVHEVAASADAVRTVAAVRAAGPGAA